MRMRPFDRIRDRGVRARSGGAPDLDVAWTVGADGGATYGLRCLRVPHTHLMSMVRHVQAAVYSICVSAESTWTGISAEATVNGPDSVPPRYAHRQEQHWDGVSTGPGGGGETFRVAPAGN